MDNIGVGIDIEDIERFRGFLKKDKNNFLSKVFSAPELEHCYSQGQPAQHLAARFAAKEAVIKALGSLGKEVRTYNMMEIVNTQSGAPVVRLNGWRLKCFCVKISITHTETAAAAVAIVSVNSK